jgi:hypothetical protein
MDILMEGKDSTMSRILSFHMLGLYQAGLVSGMNLFDALMILAGEVSWLEPYLSLRFAEVLFLIIA